MGTTCQLRLSHHPYDSVRRYRWGRGISSGLKYIADTVADGTGWTEMELKSSEYFREGSFKMKRGNSLRNTEQWRETKTYPHHLSPDIRRCSMNRNDCKYFGICITATTDLSWYPGTSPDIQPPLPCTLESKGWGNLSCHLFKCKAQVKWGPHKNMSKPGLEKGKEIKLLDR